MFEKKFSRTKNYVGKLTSGFYDDRIGHLLVGTEENVIAALNVENGDIVWRRVLEKSDRGSIQFLQSLSDDFTAPNSLRVSGRQEPDRYFVAVTGTNFVLVRIWNIRSGNLGWEWSFQPTITSNDNAHYFATPTTLYYVQPNWEQYSLEVTAYDIKSGQIDTTTRKINVASSQKQNCDFVQSFLVCLNAGEVTAIDLVTGSKKVVAKATSKPKIVNVSLEKTFLGENVDPFSNVKENKKN